MTTSIYFELFTSYFAFLGQAYSVSVMLEVPDSVNNQVGHIYIYIYIYSVSVMLEVLDSGNNQVGKEPPVFICIFRTAQRHELKFKRKNNYLLMINELN